MHFLKVLTDVNAPLWNHHACRKRSLSAPLKALLLAWPRASSLVCFLLPSISRILCQWNHCCSSHFCLAPFTHSSCVNSSFLLIAEWRSVVWMNTSQFVCTFICWRTFGLFPRWSHYKNTSMNVHLHMFCEHVFHVSWVGRCPAVEFAGS